MLLVWSNAGNQNKQTENSRLDLQYAILTLSDGTQICAKIDLVLEVRVQLGIRNDKTMGYDRLGESGTSC